MTELEFKKKYIILARELIYAHHELQELIKKNLGDGYNRQNERIIDEDRCISMLRTMDKYKKELIGEKKCTNN